MHTAWIQHVHLISVPQNIESGVCWGEECEGGGGGGGGGHTHSHTLARKGGGGVHLTRNVLS